MTWPFGELQQFGYDLVMVDVPTEHKMRSPKGEKKSAQAKYGCISFAEAERLPVGNLVRNHSVLFLWWTWPHLFHGGDPAKHYQDHDARITPAGRLIHAWGARYVTGGAWFKRSKNGHPAMGPGYRLRSVCEPYFIAIWGNPATMGRTTRNFIESFETDNGIDGLRREHSRKPEEAYSYCDRYLPDASKCELFSRQSRPGWSSWGYEAGKFDPVVTLASEAAA